MEIAKTGLYQKYFVQLWLINRKMHIVSQHKIIRMVLFEKAPLRIKLNVISSDWWYSNLNNKIFDVKEAGNVFHYNKNEYLIIGGDDEGKCILKKDCIVISGK